MSWHWRLEDPNGVAVDPATVGVEMPETDNSVSEAASADFFLPSKFSTLTGTSRSAFSRWPGFMSKCGTAAISPFR